MFILSLFVDISLSSIESVSVRFRDQAKLFVVTSNQTVNKFLALRNILNCASFVCLINQRDVMNLTLLLDHNAVVTNLLQEHTSNFLFVLKHASLIFVWFFFAFLLSAYGDLFFIFALIVNDKHKSLLFVLFHSN